jgi:ankyrin repeat protein
MRLLVAALVCAASAADTASQKFCDAALERNLEAVKQSIRDGADIDYQCTTPIGTATALGRASEDGHAEVVRFLIEAGADANTVDYQGASPLYIAAQQNHGDVVRLLLAEVDPRDSILPPVGTSPLHTAAFHGSTAAVEILLEDGRLPVDGRSAEGRTPLHSAATAGQLKIIEALLRHGADATIAWIGMTPADVASQNGHDEVAALLKEAERKGPAREQASEAFCDAAKRGDLKAVEKSLSNGVDVDYPCTEGDGTMVALYIASYLGHTEIVKELLSRGANATLVASKGSSSLYAAAQNNHSGVVALLLEEADPLHSIWTKADRSSPLHIAARYGSTEALEILLADGRLPINGITNSGATPIYNAARNGQLGGR